MLLQELWIEKLDWDDEVSPQIAHCWEEFREDLVQLKNVSVPRWLAITENAQLEIHGFSDASQLAMAAVVFLKVTDGNGVRISLICSKTKVAPLKRLTITRLELTAAVLLAKLVKYVHDQLKLSNVPTYLWTESSVTLHWISSHPSRWKEFVRNRVQLLQELSSAQWKFVSGKENPADCAFRGLTAAQLASHKLWWQGPQWLRRDSSSWPEFSSTPISSIDLEEKPGVILNVKVQHQEIWDLIHRYSSLNKLLRITAICQRLIARFKKIPKSSLSYALTPGDIEQAGIFWIKASQSAHFSLKLLTLSRGQKLSSAHPLTRLTSFIDHQGVLHVGGRLKFADFICDSLLTFEDLTTLLAKIEAVLNSRPLEPLSEDPDDVSALTPGHFLIGQALSALPEPSLEDLNIARLSRWQLIQQMVQSFWNRWSTRYLQYLQSISKWHHPSNEIKVGSIVPLTDERFPPTKWPLARVTARHPGKDGLTRVVSIKTSGSTLQRPIAKLDLLPVSTNSE